MNINSRDDQTFLNRLTAIAETNLSDENFGVSELAAKLGVSRSFLHRRLRAIKNKSASQFMKEFRLEKSKEILEKENLTVSEISYKVGFGSPSYFIKCFHEYFGYAPGEMKRNLIIEDNSLGKENFSVQKKYNKRSKIVIFITAIIILSVTGWFIYKHIKHAGQGELSIIVLPFINLSDDPSNKYFADGIREDILNNLYRITSLRVISNTTSEYFRENALTAREIAHQIKVNYVLEGSVRRYENKFRISIQLIDPEKDDHLWSYNFDHDMNDIINVQSEIALQVAEQLKAVIPENEIRQIERITTQNPKAYDYYLQARFLLHQSNSPQRSGLNASGVINSVQYYKKAIEEDSTFAEAYAGLANAVMNLAGWGIVKRTDLPYDVDQLCQKAIEIDAECAEAYAIMGYTDWVKRKYKIADELLRKSIEINPNFASSRQWYAQLLMATGPISEARKQVNKAVELEPYFWVVKNLDSWIAYFEKDYNRSLEVCQVAHDLNPDFSSNMWLFFLNKVKLNQGKEACDQLKMIAKKYSKSDDYSAEIEEAYANKGIDGLLNCMISINKTKPIQIEGLNGSPFYIAWWYGILGNKEEALDWLEKTIANKIAPYHFLTLILNLPDFEFLKDDPRFFKITEEIGISEYF